MKKCQKIMVATILLVIAIFSAYLFYNQATGKFFSDLATQIDYALNGAYQYSITGQIYKLIINYLGGYIGIAIFLSIVTIVNIFITKKVLEYYIKEKRTFLIWIYSILLNFIIAIHIPLIYKMWVVGVQEPTEWHNSTYICMKPLGLLAILLYFSIEKNYLEKIDMRKYILFCIILILVNSVKPNFIAVFAPTMLIFLIIDFFRKGDKKAIRNMIIFGCAVLISLPVLFYQQSVLYADNSGSTIQLGFMTVLKIYNEKPIISLIQSAAFPLFVLITNFKTIIKERRYSFVFVLNIVALAEYILLEETGKRAAAGNFAWGYSFSLMMAFICSVAIISNLSKKEEKPGKIYFGISYSLLTLHILSGLVYFGRLLLGCQYF